MIRKIYLLLYVFYHSLYYIKSLEVYVQFTITMTSMKKIVLKKPFLASERVNLLIIYF